ncbi:MAG: D-alanyl-D-alanine carboxypeptidase/D-alanyl-D-alanine-endopeptidase [Pseudomonadota bacterium]|nr:D-alanyl-D-alanine carboxypeptidase/D-alanyl-D-alanine-endopeptidase [Pseudomonadota bacterium]
MGRARTAAFAILIALCGSVAHAALPRGIARSFVEAGVPLNSVAVVVQEVDAPRPLFTHQPLKPMSPASVMKLVTTFAALELLGPSYRWRTEAYVDGILQQGTLKGDLVLKGYGDPKITIEQWQALMSSIRAAGIRDIDGDLVLDRTAFDVPRHDAAAFDAAPLRAYNVGPDALLVNFKTVRFVFAADASGQPKVSVEPPLASIHVVATPSGASSTCSDWRAGLLARFVDRGSDADASFAGSYPAACGEKSWYVALLDAPSYAHAMFTTYFAAAGGSFRGAWRSGVAPRGTPAAVLESPPLYDIVRDVNKLSNNVMARQVFLTLGLADSGPPATPLRSARAVEQWLRARKMPMPELVIENGSGLSRSEQISASGLVRLLVAADKSAVRNEFATSLAVAATDGTVENRFRQGSVAGQALLKTGTLESVRALAGYVIDGDGRRFAIAAIINDRNASRGQPALDALVQWVYAYGAAWARATR